MSVHNGDPADEDEFNNAFISQDDFQHAIADNQVAYASIVGLLLNSTLYRAADIEYTIYRTDGAVERRERGVLFCSFKPIANAWSFERFTHQGDDALNVATSLNVTAAGQAQYKSDSLGGTYTGSIVWKIIAKFSKEV